MKPTPSTNHMESRYSGWKTLPASSCRRMTFVVAGIVSMGLASCISPPPPRQYNPQTARHLRNLSHDYPVTPIPAEYGGWGYPAYCYDGFY